MKNSIVAIRIINRNNEESIKGRLQQLGKVASGSTISGVNSKIVIDGLTVVGEIYAPHNAKYTNSQYNFLESGRKPGSRMPPVSNRSEGTEGALVPWMKLRGIPLKYEYPIAKAMAIKGVAPVDVTKPAIKKVEAENLRLAKDAIKEDLRRPIAEMLYEQVALSLKGTVKVT